MKEKKPLLPKIQLSDQDGFIRSRARAEGREMAQGKPGRNLRMFPVGQVVMTSDIEAYKFCHGCGAKMEG